MTICCVSQSDFLDTQYDLADVRAATYLARARVVAQGMLVFDSSASSSLQSGVAEVVNGLLIYMTSYWQGENTSTKR